MAMISNDWLPALQEEFHKDYYKKLYTFVRQEYSTHVIYPPADDIFNALHLTPLKDVKVLILGQDPYHNVNQAHGLSFSVLPTQPEIPPSLQNIYKELHDDVGCPIPRSGNLTRWAKQGVLLLNTALTVRAHMANSHKNCGWTWFTDAVISLISEKREHVVFILWGGNARSKKPLIDPQKHLILECAHPSPLSAYNGFFGCRHFSKTNEYLTSHGIAPIDWDLTAERKE